MALIRALSGSSGGGGNVIVDTQSDSVSAGLNTKTMMNVTNIISVLLVLSNGYVAYGYKNGDSYSFVNPASTHVHMDAINNGNQIAIGSGYSTSCTFYVVGE